MFFTSWRDDAPFGVLLFDFDFAYCRACGEGEDVIWDAVDVADRPESKHDDFTDWPATSLGRVGAVVGLLGVEGELAEIADDPAGSMKQPQGPPVCLMVGDGQVALVEALVAVLALAGVVKAIVGSPAVPVAMLAAGGRVGEQEHVRALHRGADSAEAAARRRLTSLGRRGWRAR